MDNNPNNVTIVSLIVTQVLVFISIILNITSIPPRNSAIIGIVLAVLYLSFKYSFSVTHLA